MKFEFKFKNINVVNKKNPICKFELNGDDIFYGKVKENLTFDEDAQENNILRIYFVNKDGRDTILDNNNEITKDLNFELEKVIIILQKIQENFHLLNYVINIMIKIMEKIFIQK